MKRITFKRVIYLIIITIILVVSAQNFYYVDLKFFAYQFPFPLIILLGFVFLTGYLSAILFSGIFKKTKKEEKKIKNEEITGNI